MKLRPDTPYYTEFRRHDMEKDIKDAESHERMLAE